MNERGCYCPPDGVQPEHLKKRGVPEGFCGICERCGQPGHTRHFPGPVPYTGAWCDRCYRLVGRGYMIRRAIMWSIILIAVAILAYFLFFR